MSEKLNVRVIGDKSLRKVAEPVEEITPEIKQIVSDMKETMYARDGIGLAAPQIGIGKRIFVVDIQWYKEGNSQKPIVCINPEFIEFIGEDTAEEGCLSLPGIFEKVTRAEQVVMEALNEKNEKFKLEADGMFARALQHEYDHLEGILFVDKVPKMKRIFIGRAIRELERQTDEKGVNLLSENMLHNET
jgi:peptide deformylase